MNIKNHLSKVIIIVITALIAWSCSEFADSPYPPVSFVGMTSIPGNGRASAVAFSIYSKGYVALGRDSTKTQLKDCWEYDPSNNSWTEKTPFPGIARVKSIAAVVNGKAYVGLGFNDSLTVFNYLACLKDFWMFDPVLNSWTQKADFPSNFTDACVSFVYNNNIYVGSGFNGDTFGNDFWKYIPTENTWVKLNNFAGYKRAAAVSCTNGKHVYFGTGYRTINENDWWEYFPASDTWNWIGYMPDNGRENAVSFSIDNRFFITTGRQFGGTLTGGHVISDIYEFDAVRKVWYNRGDLPGARENAVAFVINGVGYIGFGENDSKVFNDFWSFEP
jgi:N-acetylneuraminic acid mutarotase